MSINKNLAAIMVFALLVLELAIFLAAASHSGIKYRTIIEDNKGRILYETPGKGLSYYEEMSLRNTIGPVENYHVRVVARRVAFPFTAWLSASVGVPVGLILIYALIFRIYRAIIEAEPASIKLSAINGPDRGWRRLISFFHSLSVFHIGLIVFLVALFAWLVPHVTVRTLTGMISFIKENMAIFVVLTICLLILAGWVAYLMYRLAKEMLRYRYEITKLQLEKALEYGDDYRKLLPGVSERQLEDKKDRPHEVV